MTYTRKQLETFLALEDFQEIYAQADALRAETVGDIVHIRALLEFSNNCKRLCCYCGLNAPDKNLPRFRMDPRDMISTAQEACQAGYKTIVLQSGEDPWYTPDKMCIRDSPRLCATNTNNSIKDTPVTISGLTIGRFVTFIIIRRTHLLRIPWRPKMCIRDRNNNG